MIVSGIMDLIKRIDLLDSIFKNVSLNTHLKGDFLGVI